MFIYICNIYAQYQSKLKCPAIYQIYRSAHGREKSKKNMIQEIQTNLIINYYLINIL